VGKRKEPRPQPASAPTEPAGPASPTIHEAELASGGSGAVEYGAEFDEQAAVATRKNGNDIVVRGDHLTANRNLARRIEAQVGQPSPPQFPHTKYAGPKALPHFHQQVRIPAGHSFYETDKRKARKKP
jgi:hypothetical protein